MCKSHFRVKPVLKRWVTGGRGGVEGGVGVVYFVYFTFSVCVSRIFV